MCIRDRLWHTALGKDTSIHTEQWPKYNPALIKEDKVNIAVQINGKTRGTVALPQDAPQKEAEEAAMKEAGVKKHLPDRSKIKKTIYVPGKIINFVI